MSISLSSPLTEPIAVQDTFISGLARIEDLGGNWRFIFYTLHRPLCGGDHDLERVVAARLVVSKEAAALGMLQSMAIMDTEVFPISTN